MVEPITPTFSHEDIISSVRAVFGADLVEDAWINGFPGMTGDEAEEYFGSCVFFGTDKWTGKDLSHDGLSLCIKFRNGKTVEFWTDGAGGMRRATGRYRNLSLQRKDLSVPWG